MSDLPVVTPPNAEEAVGLYFAERDLNVTPDDDVTVYAQRTAVADHRAAHGPDAGLPAERYAQYELFITREGHESFEDVSLPVEEDFVEEEQNSIVYSDRLPEASAWGDLRYDVEIAGTDL